MASSPSDADFAVIRARLDQAPTRDAARDLLGGLTLKTLTGWPATATCGSSRPAGSSRSST